MGEAHEHIGPYRIVRELGRGGQAIVYLAEHRELGRAVALKVLKHAAVEFKSDAAFLRFKREAEVTSRLDHSGICGVYEAGEDDGCAFIAMQYVRGEPLSVKLNRARSANAGPSDSSFFLSTEDDIEPAAENAGDPPTTGSAPSSRGEVFAALRLIERTARAMHVAHESGLVHRDIKPGNIMITEDGDPVLLDFGLARDESSLEHTLTQQGELMGTPYYMSPEQLLAQHVPIDRRTDVYSLGVTLFECLTLVRPYDAPSRDALYQKIIGADPPDPRVINAHIPRDAKIVIETAMDRDQNRRYQTALAFAEDLARIRKFEPIAAQPLGPWLRARRWTQRHPVLASSLALLLLALGASIALSVWALGERSAKDRERRAAVTANDEKEKALGRLANALARSEGLRLAARATQLSAKDPALALLLAIEAAERAPGVESDGALRDALDAHRVERVIRGATFGHLGDVQGACFSPDGTRVAVAWPRAIGIFDIETGDQLRAIRRPGPGGADVAFSPDGSRLLTWGGRNARIWTATGRELFALTGHESLLTTAVFSPDGKSIATAARDGTARLWDAASGRTRSTLVGHTGSVVAVSFDPSGRRLATRAKDGAVRLWNATTGQLERVLEGLDATANGVAFSPDGTGLITGGKTATLWNAANGERKWSTSEKFKAPRFSPDGTRIVGLANEGADLRAADSGARTRELRGQPRFFSSARFSPDGRRIVTGTFARALVWDASSGKQLEAFPVYGTRPLGFTVPEVEFSRDGSRLVTWCDAAACVWRTRREIEHVRMQDAAMPRFDPIRNRVIARAPDGRVRTWDGITGRMTQEFASGRVPKLVHGFALDPTGRRLAVTDGSGGTLWDLETGSRVGPLQADLRVDERESHMTDDEIVRWVAFSADGTHVLGHGTTRVVWLWDARTGERRHSLRGHTDYVPFAGFANGGSHVVTAAHDGTARVWDVATGRCASTIELRRSASLRLSAIAPTSPRFITVDERVAWIRSLESGQVELELSDHPAAVSCTGFSPDGGRVVTGCRDGSVRLFDAQDGKLVHELRGHDARVFEARFSRDGRWLVTSSRDRTTRLWDARAGRALAMVQSNDAPIMSARFSADGRRFVTGAGDWVARVWEIDPLPTARARRVRAFTLAELDTFDLGDRTLRDRVRAAFERHPLERDFVAALDRLDGLPPLVRRAAIQAARFRETPNHLNNTSWGIAVRAGEPIARYRLAVRLAEAALRLDPEDTAATGSLGVARYRAGDYTGALETLARARQQSAATNNDLFAIFEFAFIAMCHHRLGHAGDAKRALASARAALGDSTDEASLAFVREAQALIEPE